MYPICKFVFDEKYYFFLYDKQISYNKRKVNIDFDFQDNNCVLVVNDTFFIPFDYLDIASLQEKKQEIEIILLVKTNNIGECEVYAKIPIDSFVLGAMLGYKSAIQKLLDKEQVTNANKVI